MGEGSHIENAIVDKNARIGKRVRIINDGGHEEADGENFFVRDGIVLIPKNVTIPDDTVI